MQAAAYDNPIEIFGASSNVLGNWSSSTMCLLVKEVTVV
jgi:hypothetical protein